MEDDTHQIPQAGAVPYQLDEHGHCRVLIITTKAGLWSIPKGLIDPGRTPQQMAEVESLEEAGVIGRVDGPPLGEFSYHKWDRLCVVTVYPLRIDRVLERWAEDDIRDRDLVSIHEAASRIERPGVAPLIRALHERLECSLIRTAHA